MSALKPAAENRYAAELEHLRARDARAGGWKPANWRLSPQAVVDFVVGAGKKDEVVTAKYVGERRLIEACVATLATDRALLIVGEPGTAKSMVSELLAAAISGDSRRLIQCSAGTEEHHLRYTWNYGEYLNSGPTRKALVISPLLDAMEEGAMARLEEFTRLSPDVQDAIISILSDKAAAIPELHETVEARPGFNLIATANDRDQGVYEMSAALRRRFNVVRLPPPATLAAEVHIITRRVRDELARLGLKSEEDSYDGAVGAAARVFRELRAGEGAAALSHSASTAEAIETVVSGVCEASFFGDGRLDGKRLGAHLAATLVKDPARDRQIVCDYAQLRLREGDGKKSYEIDAIAALQKAAS